MSKTIAEAFRRAALTDPRPLLQITRAAGLDYALVYRFVHGQSKGIRLASAERLAKVLNLELRPTKRRVKRGERCK